MPSPKSGGNVHKFIEFLLQVEPKEVSAGINPTSSSSPLSLGSQADLDVGGFQVILVLPTDQALQISWQELGASLECLLWVCSAAHGAVISSCWANRPSTDLRHKLLVL